MLYQVAALGIFTYLAAILRHTKGMTARETVMPLALVGLGAMAGSLIGGRVAGQARRLRIGGAAAAAAVVVLRLQRWSAQACRLRVAGA